MANECHANAFDFGLLSGCNCVAHMNCQGVWKRTRFVPQEMSVAGKRWDNLKPVRFTENVHSKYSITGHCERDDIAVWQGSK